MIIIRPKKQNYLKLISGIICLIFTFSLLPYKLLATKAEAETTTPPAQYSYFPTASEVDGRFLEILGEGFNSLAGDRISINISVPGDYPELEIGIFDGKTGVTWDSIDSYKNPTQMNYTVYAEPDPSKKLHSSELTMVTTISGSKMTENGWYDIKIPQSPSAKTPSGIYYYRLEVTNPNPKAPVANVFKVRSTGRICLTESSTFAFMAALDYGRTTIYPNYPSREITTYDGTWDFYFNVPTDVKEISVWDGDLDYGQPDPSKIKDTDDQDTPNLAPTWSPNAKPEGVASTSTTSTGAPSDDTNDLDKLRTTAINYKLITPDNQIFNNLNPSGNAEWEQFKISTESFDRNKMDYHADSLPRGIYQIHVDGADMGNLNGWHCDYKILGVDENGKPMIMLNPYVLGDMIWDDINNNGKQDNGEIGIPNVKVNLIDYKNNIIASATTNSAGNYVFKIDTGEYKVQIDPSNFQKDGALENFKSSTGGNSSNLKLVSDSDYTFDFGYHKESLIGDRVWLDINNDGMQDSNEPGIEGMTVKLLKNDGTPVLGDDGKEIITVTDVNGNYSFKDIPKGDYKVQFISHKDFYKFGEKNKGTADNDSNADKATGVTDVFTLNYGDINKSIDAAFTVKTGLTVEKTAYIGKYTAGKAGSKSVSGINGEDITYIFSVTNTGDTYIKELVINDISLKVDQSKFTKVSGEEPLSPGASIVYYYETMINGDLTNKVEVSGTASDKESNTVPNVDKLSSSDTAEAKALGSIGDRVWNDLNKDGIQDTDEPGLKDITVKLTDSKGNTITTTTDDKGNYIFDSLTSDKYTISIDQATLPKNMEETFEKDNSKDNKVSLALKDGEVYDDVDFGYKEKEGTLVVKYLEEGTNKELDKTETTIKPIETDYITSPKDIPWYKLVKIEGFEKGKYVEDTTTVTYYYMKQTGTLTIKYVDETGKELLPYETFSKEVVTDYTTNKKNIKDYDFVRVEGAEKGTYINGNITVTYIYKMKQGTLVIKYLEEGSNKELALTETNTKGINTEYTTSKQNINDYEFVKVEGKETGTYVEGTTTITYYYKKTLKSSTPEVNETKNTTEANLPKTGSDISYGLYSIGLLSLVVGLYFFRRK